jgi:hypothetical protein
MSSGGITMAAVAINFLDEDFLAELMDGFEEKWEQEEGYGNTVRETSASDVRARWSIIKAHREKLEQEHEAELLHWDLHPDVDQRPIVRPSTVLEDWYERIGVLVCRYFHPTPTYQRGQMYSNCLCGRKYALPWADPSQVETEVYLSATTFVKPESPTVQAKCKHGTQGVV